VPIIPPVKRWLLIAAGVLAATVIIPFAVLAQAPDEPPPPPENPGSIGISRIEKAVLADTGQSCDASPEDIVCVVLPADEYTVQVQVPQTSGRVDVVMTVTFTYRTSPGDTAIASASRKRVPAVVPPCPPPGCPQPRSRALAPRAYVLAPADGPGTSTSLSWVVRNLSPAQYRFSFFAAPKNTNDDDRYSVLIKKATIVIETWSAGN
jgi:hypothetical protein